MASLAPAARETPITWGEGGGAGRPGFAPARRFMLLLGTALAISTVLLGGVMAWVVQRHLEEETISLTRNQVELHFRDVFGDAVFTGPIDAALAQRFDSMVKQHFGIYDIVQLRLYTKSGRVIYNYLPGLVPPPGTPPEVFSQPPPEGLPAEHEGHLRRAFAGELTTQRTAMAADESVSRQALGSVLQVYVPVRRGGEVIGVAEVFRDISRQEAETRRVQLAMLGAVVAGSVGLFAALTRIFRDATGRVRRQGETLAHTFEDLAAAHDQSLAALAAALETRDRETEGHCERVTRYSRALGEVLGLPEDELAGLERGALLHDIGKIGVPDAVLRKAGPLVPHEWEQMRRHPEIGADMVGRIHFLAAALPVVRHHHERYDGKGYPDQMMGEGIPLAARIFSVADTFDAMTSDRPYRNAASVEEARAEIARNAGTQFDPRVVGAFMGLSAQRLREIRLEVAERGVVGA